LPWPDWQVKVHCGSQVKTVKVECGTQQHTMPGGGTNRTLIGQYRKKQERYRQ
jgi:hypothetical protein